MVDGLSKSFGEFRSGCDEKTAVSRDTYLLFLSTEKYLTCCIGVLPTEKYLTSRYLITEKYLTCCS